jgi:hypothetical protein
VYQGPVVLITDARCYSATDIFAAGFQDHKIGPVLGVDANTGAGGANVWTHDLLRQLLEKPGDPDPQSPYQKLPKGAGMRVSIRRTLRVGAFAGTPVEDLGVIPDERHDLTRNDVLHDNADLMDRVGELLAGMTVRRLDVDATATARQLQLDVVAENVDRADIYVDGRPRASLDTPPGASSHMIQGVVGATVVRAEGFADGGLVAARTIRI